MKYIYKRKGNGREIARAIAEKVLGHPLPNWAVMHHVDGNETNNEHTNLVICEDAHYHHFLHLRTAAYVASGDVNQRPCWICQKHDKLENLVKIKTAGFHHRECYNEHQRDYLLRKKVKDISKRDISFIYHSRRNG
jgi:hypothetical protein